MVFKFRFWDKELKEMHYQFLEDLCGNEIRHDGATDVWAVLNDSRNKQERFVVMQGAGLLDKSGLDIYEGDILEYSVTFKGTTLQSILEVYFDRNIGQWMVNDLVSPTENHSLFTELRLDRCDVVGNIYENNYEELL